MVKKKEVALVCFVLLALFLAGCRARQEVEPDATEKIYKGTDGLVMTFLKDNPPDKLWDTSTLDIIVGLANKGTSDLSGTRCALYLSGYDKDIIRGLPQAAQCGLLEPKSSLNPEGSYTTVEFSTDHPMILSEGIDSLDQGFMVTACYEYETNAKVSVCIDPHLYDIGPVDRVCNVRDVTLTGGQGAPVSVDKVEVNMAENKVLFKIRVSNKGGAVVKKSIFSSGKTQAVGQQGVVFDYDASLGNCPGSLDPRDYNLVSYVVEMGGVQGACKPQRNGLNKVPLVDNKGIIYCTFSVSPADLAHTKVLSINLFYNYMDSIIKEVTIWRTP